mgnify:CR=1 FL=1
MLKLKRGGPDERVHHPVHPLFCQNPFHIHSQLLRSAQHCSAGALLAEELRPRGIAVANLHPGFNRTDMTRKYEAIWDIEGAVESEVGAKRVLHEVGRVGLLESGCPFVNCEDGLLIPY